MHSQSFYVLELKNCVLGVFEALSSMSLRRQRLCEPSGFKKYILASGNRLSMFCFGKYNTEYIRLPNLSESANLDNVRV